MRRFLLPCILGFLGPLLSGPAVAAAASVEARSKIEAVTIFPSSALVTRTAELELPAGPTTLIFKGLPKGLDPASLRVSGQASSALVIGSVATRLSLAEPAADNAIEARLKALRSDRDGWQVTRDSLEAEKAMMLRFSQAGPEKLGPDSEPLPIPEWNKAWETVGAGLAKLGDELRSAQARIRELDEAIAANEATRARPAIKAEPGREVTVETETDAPSKVRITLAYHISGASWRPRYEARLDTGGAGQAPSLEFFRRAEISQATGEDWDDVALTVSTVRIDQGGAAPNVEPQRIAFREAIALPSAAMRPMPKASAAPNGVPEPGVAQAAPPPPPLEATEQSATVNAEAFAASFQIAGRASLPSGVATKTLPISSRKLTPQLSDKTAPALDQTTYLAARFANEDDAPTLLGAVALYRDGSFLGSGKIDFAQPGDVVELSFGADDRVKVSRAPVRRKENEPVFYGQTKIETREFKTSVENRHDFPLKITVVDAIPFSENTAIVVDQLSATTPPTEKNVGDRRGVMQWTYDYAPQEKREIRLAYKMKWPADRDVVIEPAPLPNR